MNPEVKEMARQERMPGLGRSSTRHWAKPEQHGTTESKLCRIYYGAEVVMAARQTLLA